MSMRYGFARRCRKHWYGELAEAGMTERKHLPVGLVRRRQKIYKITGGLAHGAYTCGEGREVTCASTPLERLNISFSPSVSDLLLL